MMNSLKRTRRLLLVILAARAGVRLVKGSGKNEAGYRSSRLWRVYTSAAQALDHARGWHGVPVPVGLATLVALRTTLRRRNLYDTTNQPAVDQPSVAPPDARNLTQRTVDGTYNDLQNPAMGMAGSRFGRNMPIEFTAPEPAPAILEPNPRTVSRELLTRAPFQPATSANALVAAWIQFMVRDWFSHGTSPKDNPWELPLPSDDPWPEHPMRILRVPPDPTRPAGDTSLPPTYTNTETHWWDASQIYGSTQAFSTMVRSGEDGKLIIGPDRLLPLPSDPRRNPALVPGWWLGIELMHTLFVLEHNAICDRLRQEYPAWSDDELFQHARLINAALLAKIHTVEWTPAVIAHPTTQIAMRANWWGLQMERLHKLVGRLSPSEVFSGIPGSKTDHYGVPYALTEEFTAVYRMHPLVPDDFSFRSARDDSPIREETLRDIAGPQSHELMQQVDTTDLFYSFGTMHPGLVTLHNFPRFLQEFVRPDGQIMDLAAVDILRMRELGVPRYNQFRRLLHLKPATSFETLTANPVWAEELRRVYDNDLEAVDLMVGMFAEPLPRGFAFSDTAFRIFILMASRRLNSDRFFTTDFNARVYTQAGMDWISDNDMVSVLLRHYPGLGPALRGVGNAFAPWTKASA